MPPSISRRIRRTVLAVTCVSVLIVTVVAYFAQEAMEHAMLESDLQASRDFVVDNAEKNEVLHWQTDALHAFYEPRGLVGTEPLPEMFRHHPFPFSGEIETGGQTYLMTAGEEDGGRLYLAKNITSFEARVQAFAYLIAAGGLVALTLAIALAHLGSRRVIRPLQRLTRHIRATTPGQHMARAPTDGDLELRTIAETFNLFLDELEAYVKREQSLLSLSSHELRTPIAVITGALDVISLRGQLAGNDQITLRRARQAATEMKANIDMILKLGRREEVAELAELVVLPHMVAEVVEDLDRAIGQGSRVHVRHADDVTALSDPVLLKMLLRNLIQNALQHTTGDVYVRLAPGLVEIEDRGAGLPAGYRDLLHGKEPGRSQRAAMSGLGLIIVTLICERLRWHLDAAQAEPQGTVMRLGYGTHATASTAS